MLSSELVLESIMLVNLRRRVSLASPHRAKSQLVEFGKTNATEVSRTTSCG